MVQYGAVTAAILNGNIVDAVCMEHKHLCMARNGVFTGHAAVVELHFETHRLEGNVDKMSPCSLLMEAKKSARVDTNVLQMYINTIEGKHMVLLEATR